MLEEALELERESEVPWLTGLVLESLAEVEEEVGLRDAASAHLEECGVLAARVDDPDLASITLFAWARLAVIDDPELAIRLMAAVDVEQRSIGAVLQLPVRQAADSLVQNARGRLSASTVGGAWQEG